MDINTLINLSNLPFIANDKSLPFVIAGPCSAESLEQTITTAQELNKMGITVFRAGLWKPRTLPNSFEGVGTKGLEWLKSVRQQTGMSVATEVATQEHVNAVIDAGIDIVWIGARTCTNPFAVQEIADSLKGHNEITVLVKNPVNPDIDLWIGALQRLNNAGITRLGAILRGFSSYSNNIFRNNPEWHIAIELHRRFPQLPIFCDPSHMGGKRELIAPLSQQACDMGFNGLFIETHCDPDNALSDSEQQISPQDLKNLINTLIVRSKTDSNENLNMYRGLIDDCDNQLLNILSKRMNISREIGVYKKEHDIQVVYTDRFDKILQKCMAQAEQLGMSESFIKEIITAIHRESVRQQIDILNK